MLIDGFFAEVLERVPSERLRERVARVLQEKLGRWTTVRGSRVEGRGPAATPTDRKLERNTWQSS
jgi:hypothetical protein